MVGEEAKRSPGSSDQRKKGREEGRKEGWTRKRPGRMEETDSVS